MGLSPFAPRKDVRSRRACEFLGGFGSGVVSWTGRGAIRRWMPGPKRRCVVDQRRPEPQPSLFPEPDSATPADSSASPTPTPRRPPRLRRPERRQATMRVESLDQRLEADHPARMIWAYVESLDLTELLDQVRAVEGRVGRDATDPRIPFALWLLASVDGVASGRELAELTENHRAYEWLCGGVSVNYHLLSDFRSRNAEF